MHYYQFNIADYRKDTAHLSPIEHYIYRQLIDWYYLDETPIPKKTQSVMRRLSLDAEHEPKLQNVLDDFFEESANGWVHDRIATEIEKYHTNAKKNATNGRKGGRPKKQQVKSEEEPRKTQSVSSGNPNESQKKPNQEPITNNQEPIVNTKTPCAPGDAPVQNVANATECNADEKLPSRFADWWSKYPVKRNKKKSYDIWKRRKLDKIADQLIDDVKIRAANDHDWLRGFIPHPTTYLNGDRWDDELTRPPEKHSNQNGNRASGSALDKVLSGIEAAHRRDHGSPVGHDDAIVRPSVGEQLRREGRPDGGVGSVIEGDYTRND